jgi:hypothetical protein
MPRDRKLTSTEHQVQPGGRFQDDTRDPAGPDTAPAQELAEPGVTAADLASGPSAGPLASGPSGGPPASRPSDDPLAFALGRDAVAAGLAGRPLAAVPDEDAPVAKVASAPQAVPPAERERVAGPRGPQPVSTAPDQDAAAAGDPPPMRRCSLARTVSASAGCRSSPPSSMTQGPR